MLTMLIGLALAAQTPAPPSDEAIALGRRLAETGTLANLLPIIAQQETDAMIREHPEFTDAERATLRQASTEVMQANRVRVVDAMGRAYAAQLGAAELRDLIVQQESPAARRMREVLPQVMVATMQTLGGSIDFGRDLRAAMCQRTHRLCETPR